MPGGSSKPRGAHRCKQPRGCRRVFLKSPSPSAAIAGTTNTMDKILIIDDKHSILESLDMFFAEKGYRVFTADCGAPGLALCRRHEPDVVILDIRLPDTHGITVLEQIQALDKPVKVIMMTAFQDMETTIQAMKLGAYDYHSQTAGCGQDRKGRRTGPVYDENRPGAASGCRNHPASQSRGHYRQERPAWARSSRPSACFRKTGHHVLIQGATGTGKELIARVIHRNSLYAREPFVTFDCSAVVETPPGKRTCSGTKKALLPVPPSPRRAKLHWPATERCFLTRSENYRGSCSASFSGFCSATPTTAWGATHPLTSRCRIIAATNRNLADRVNQ